MQLEFRQLERRLEHLRAHRPERQQRLLASLAASGQQTPIIVIATDEPSRYLLIDGYRRVRALEQLGRDTVEAVVWSLSEAEALFLDRSMRAGEQATALEEGWLLAEMSERFGYDQEELGRRFDRSVSWVSRRMGRDRGGAAAGAHRRDHGPCGDEVPGAGGAVGRGRLLPHGGGFCAASDAQPRSGPVVYGLARRDSGGAPTAAGRAAVVPEDAAAAREESGRPGDGGAISRSGSGDRDGAARQSPSAWRHGGTGSSAMRPDAGPDPSCARRVESAGDQAPASNRGC